MLRASISTLLISLVVCAAAHGAIIIDDFETPYTSGTLLTSSPPDTATDTTTAAGIIGSEREAVLDHISGLIMTSAVDSAVSPGALVYGETAAEVGTLTLTYDGVGSAGLGGIDFTEAGLNDKFTITVVSGADTTGVITFTATDTDGDTGSLGLTVDAIGYYEYFFSSFSGGGLVDFDSLDSIELEIDGGGTYDVSIAFVQAAPEPSSWALMALVALGVAYRARRRESDELEDCRA